MRVTVKLMAFPSVAEAEVMANIGAASSLLIVPLAVAFVELMIAPLLGLLKLTVKVSFPSNRLS